MNQARQQKTQWQSETNSMKIRFATPFVALSLIFLPFEAGFAYVGPGAGITLVGALVAVVLAIVFAFGGLFLWPYRALKRRFSNAEESTTVEARSDGHQRSTTPDEATHSTQEGQVPNETKHSDRSTI